MTHESVLPVLLLASLAFSAVNGQGLLLFDLKSHETQIDLVMSYF